MSNKFIHLHNHDEFSLLDGLGKAHQYAKRAKELGFSAIGITNHGNVDGVIKFQKACEAEGITPIIGCELYIVPRILNKQKGDKRHHITVFVKNDAGWKNLLRMLTIANVDGFYRRPRIDDAILLDHCDGLVVSTACAGSFLGATYGQYLFDKLRKKLEGDFYLEIMPHILDEQKEINRMAVNLYKTYRVPLIATNDCHYPDKDGVRNQEVLLAIQRKAKWDDPNRWRFDITGLYLKTYEEMCESFEEQGVVPKEIYTKALKRTKQIADKCSGFRIEQIPVELPKVPGYEDCDETELLYHLARKGLRTRIKKTNKKLSHNLEEYESRMKEELGLICELGFQRYFLIVWELIDWCKNNDIMTGPGRGSVGGCLVAYLLHITGVDPLEYGLIFSRFISPARIDLPDIDMDFEDIKRDQIRAHLEDCYGKHNVAGVSTFLTLKGRAALRDVARVFNVPHVDVDPAAKSIVVRSGGDFRSDFSIEDAFETFEDGIKFKKKYPMVAETAMALEGQVRGSGQHAAAMCISKEDLRDGIRCNLCKRNNILLANWDKHDAEYMGMMKLDVLGLSALTVLNEARKMIKINKGIDIVFDEITMDDPEVYKEITLGHTIGAFQIGSLGLSKFCKELKVEDFENLVHATSLWRPGTLRSGMTTEFTLRKHKQTEWTHLHPALEELTKDTFGIILYQEQVMRFMYELGGLPWKTCDTIRKVISKSQGDELFMKFKKEFAEGCVRLKTLDYKTAEKLWNELSSFGCITEDTIIHRASSNQYTGTRLTVKEAFDYQSSSNFKHRGLSVLSMWKDDQVRYNKIKRIVATGDKEVFYIRTSSNKTIKATLDHRFLINNEWRAISTAKVGDWLRCTNLQLADRRWGSGEGTGNHKICPRFRKGEGKTNDKKLQKLKLINLYKGECQKCGSKSFIEMHHKNGDHSDNTDRNTMLLCRKCHRSEYDSATFKRFQKGYYTQNEKIVEIKSVGIKATYDIEMINSPRNFIANNIVTHNSYGFNKSHAVEYSLITYWDMYLKIHHPAEFMACSLTYGSGDKKEEYVDEAKRLGLKIELPKAGISHPTKWMTKPDDNRLFVPFLEIKGIGAVSAKQIDNIVASKTNEGFFTFEKKKSTTKLPSKTVLANLEKMKAFDTDKSVGKDKLEEIEHLFDFDLSDDPMRKIRGIYELISHSISSLAEIDYAAPSKEFKLYLGTMVEVKFGYRQNVLKARKSGREGIGDIAGTGESLGGVYGFFKDQNDSAMMVFSSKLYAKKKDSIEHCSGEWLLVKANHPDKKANNIMAEYALLEEELRSCSFSEDFQFNLIKRAKRTIDPSLEECNSCELRDQCKKPVLPSPGRYNIAIVGEAPGREEDRLGRGFVGRTGTEVLWRKLKGHGLKRSAFHTTNIVKCFPSKSKTPDTKHINKCSKWIDKELSVLKPVLILAFGNTCLNYFKGQDSGIMSNSGKTEWLPKFNTWVSWCIHPASVLYTPSNEELFQKGIDNFARCIDNIGGLPFESDTIPF